jgi:alpha-D-xyloside xylohydrolase
MKTNLLLRLLPAALLIAFAFPHTAPAESFQKDQHGIVLNLKTGTLRLQVWSERIVRVTYTTATTLPADNSLAVIAKPSETQWNAVESAGSIILTTKFLRVAIDPESGAIDFQDAGGKSFLAEPANGGKWMAPLDQQRRAAWNVKQVFRFPADEAIFGLGQHQDGWMNYAGKKVRLQQENRLVGIPVLMSSRGYGILWDNPSITEVASGASAETPGTIQWSSEAGDCIDYYVLFGPELDQAIAGYRFLTGDAPMLGKWAWGLWQSRERYASQDELLWVVDQYRSRQIPLDGIVQDWQYWSPGPWGSHKLDSSRYYDPAGMIKKLHDEKIHLLISVWPKFDLHGENYQQLEKAGALYRSIYPSVYPEGQQRWYDPFNAKARALYWEQIWSNLGHLGIDGWWLDATEPELGGHWGEFRDIATGAGPGARVFNAYPLMTTTAVYQGARASAPDRRAMILTRSAYAGQQRNAAITWSGDINARWDVFAKQIPAGLNFCLSGIPYWNTDIGGFFGSKPADPGFRELFVRWFQYGAFCPLFRIHGTDQPKEIWRFSGDIYDTLLAYDRLRYRLLPYIYSDSWAVTHDRSTMMRALVMDFRDDPKVFSIADQFMFGPAIMVNPVTKAGATSRSVYLPAGSKWIDFWTGKMYAGGQTIEAAAPLRTIPLFVRGGSIIPLAPPMQSAMEKDDPIELRVYPGADGSFNFYEDQGDGYDYEKGGYATIPITWDDAAQSLTIGQRVGSFAGMEKNRAFHVVRVSDGIGAGAAPAEKNFLELSYSGSKRESAVFPPTPH